MPGLLHRSGASVDAAVIDAFAAGLAGRAIRPQDADYDAARRIWNAGIDRHPGLIARCLGTADVVRAVNFGRDNDLLVAVRGGGHNVAGRALCDDGLVIDLTWMRGVLVDPEARTVRVQGGAILGDLDRETHLHGLAVPVGTVSKTGVAGLTLGGGTGWLVRKHGLSCDNVLAFELVTADGGVVTASADSHPDLFWALRGGGGNFGVVTCFTFRAHPVSTVLAGLLVHPRDRATEVLRHYSAFMAEAPEELTAYAVLKFTPDGMPAVALAGCWCGDLAEGERVLAPLRAFGPPLLDAFQPMPFPAMQSILDGGFPGGTHNYWKSSFISVLDDTVLGILIEHANRSRSPLSGVVVENYGGGALGRVGAAETAFAQRKAEFNIVVSAQWTDPAETATHVGWARGLADALEPHTSSHLPNFQSDVDDGLVRAAFGANFARLAEVKRKYDPANFFSLNHNIKAAAA